MTPGFNLFAVALGVGCALGHSVLAQSRSPGRNGRSVIATLLPTPPVDPDAGPRPFLLAARSTLRLGRTGEAQEALERAETRLLDRAVLPANVESPDTQRAVLDVGDARRALIARDRPGALRAIDDALAMLAVAPSPALPPAPAASALPMQLAPAPAAMVQAVPSPPPSVAPAVTYALLPGHWVLDGWQYVSVPPETVPRRVEYRPLVQGQYVWRNGRWQWVPAHYVPD